MSRQGSVAHTGVADLLALTDSPAWMQYALCARVDPELFFPEKGGSPRAAKRICRVCPVCAECLAYVIGLGHEERFGVWGGLSERERRELRRDRHREVGAA